ncbi:hypothetical protein L1S35_13040 [Flavobacterium sp. AS60]|uniref:hypothetical protein n=1 Tax=Flavobacterium anseongense TaxID=2910677 RepID=UPI001F366643|nr:hypothetical protein [Flavobacterium sp. AS60]MCF6130603.1 hypothetical protein [Flavobacterium sp. AS60]
MGTLKDIEDNMKSTYSLLSERGILGGLYFGIIIFCILLSIKNFDDNKDFFPWIILMTTVIGIIMSNISYELFMPLFRLISNPVVLARANVINTKEKFKDYKEIRVFRESFLNKVGNDHLKNKIKNDEKLRQTSTYLASTNIVTSLFLFLCNNCYTLNVTLKYFVMMTLGFMFLATLIGIFSRARSLGFYIGLAYNINE